MAHWARVNEDNIVTEVLVAEDDQENWLVETLGGVWIQTSYNTLGGIHYDPESGLPSANQSKALRFNYAAGGYFYDNVRDAFIPPKRFDSWVLNEDTCLWEAPIPYPEDGGDYTWDEDAGDWVEIIQ